MLCYDGSFVGAVDRDRLEMPGDQIVCFDELGLCAGAVADRLRDFARGFVGDPRSMEVHTGPERFDRAVQHDSFVRVRVIADDDGGCAAGWFAEPDEVVESRQFVVVEQCRVDDEDFGVLCSVVVEIKYLSIVCPSSLVQSSAPPRILMESPRCYREYCKGADRSLFCTGALETEVERRKAKSTQAKQASQRAREQKEEQKKARRAGFRPARGRPQRWTRCWTRPTRFQLPLNGEKASGGNSALHNRTLAEPSQIF